MRFRRLCLEIFAFRRFFNEPIEIARFPGAQCKHRNRGGATDLSFAGQLLQSVAHQACVLLRLHLAEDCGDPTAAVDHECAALGAHVFSAIHAFLDPDLVGSHEKFIRKFQLPFPLLSDPDRKIVEAYGVWVEKSMYGKKYMGAERSTFVIDGAGKIAAIFRKVKPDEHVAIVQEALSKLAGR